MVNQVTKLRVKSLARPDDPTLAARYDAGKEIERWGRRWPVPFLRPYMRRVGREMVQESGIEVEDEIRIGDWMHQPIYDTIHFDPWEMLVADAADRIDSAIFPWRRLRRWWTRESYRSDAPLFSVVRRVRIQTRELREEAQERYWSSRNRLRIWAEHRGIW